MDGGCPDFSDLAKLRTLSALDLSDSEFYGLKNTFVIFYKSSSNNWFENVILSTQFYQFVQIFVCF